MGNIINKQFRNEFILARVTLNTHMFAHPSIHLLTQCRVTSLVCAFYNNVLLLNSEINAYLLAIGKLDI